MEAVFHIGLHKTGSTYLQALFNQNSALLLDQGTYYEPQPRYPAHHAMAWQMLRNDYTMLSEVLLKAEAAGAKRVIVSSEDLEGLLFRPWLAINLCDFLFRQGIRRISFSLVIRKQSEVFWSHYSELSKHIYADPLQLFHEAMKQGYLLFENPKPHRPAVPFWQFSFDHKRYVAAFAEHVHKKYPEVRLELFDFHKPANYPGEDFVAGLGLAGVMEEGVPDWARNARLPADEVAKGFELRFSEQLDGFRADRTKALLASRMYVDAETKQEMTQMLSQRFEGENADILARFPSASSLPPVAAK
jgi:hypothetical protein